MDLNRFKQCVDAYGGARQRWPQAERSLYDRFCGTAEGAALLAGAERVDRFLDALAIAPADAALAQRLARRAQPAWRRLGIPAAFAASAVLGFAVGYAQVQGEADASAAARLLLGPQNVQEIGL